MTLNPQTRTLAIASGKGGVGKSTVSANLALALAQEGFTVGLLDADIYGPSLPLLMGISDKPHVNEQKKMIPIYRHGVWCFSLGFLMPPDTPVIWRGLMVQGALKQLLNDVAWDAVSPTLDILLIDMPPGTGDVPLTLTQSLKLSGAVIVSTPQDLALIDARKGLLMFQKVNVPIWGILENMSHFMCPHCHVTSHPFGAEKAETEALRHQVPFLGRIPLDLDVRNGSDEGYPLVFSNPEHPISQIYREIAKNLPLHA